MKIIRVLFAVLFFASGHLTALAHGGLWIDLDAELRSMKKLVLFPMSISDDLNVFAVDGDESSAVFRQNDYLHRRLSKKLKDANLLRLAPDIGEQRIRETVSPFGALLAPAANAAARAAEVRRLTMADGFLVPHFRENWVRVDISPETVFHFTLREWTEIKDEKGTRVTEDRSWFVEHVVPEKEMLLRIMDVDYTLYDEQGREVLSFENSRRRYFADAVDMYEDLAEEFAEEVKKARKGKYRPEERGDKAVSLAVSRLTLPEEMAGDSIKEKAFRFALYDEARKRDRLQPESDKPRLLVEAEIHRCEMVPTWNPPTAWVTTDYTTSDKSWTDKDGKKHPVTKTEYTQSVEHSFGYYSYEAQAEGRLKLVDAVSGEVLMEQFFYEADDKQIDACRHGFRDFFKDVEKWVEEHEGLVKA